MTKMEEMGLHQAILLQVTYGPKPYWTKASPEVSIGDTCQTLYAVDTGNSVGYTLALVRRCDRDYPILLGMNHRVATPTECTNYFCFQWIRRKQYLLTARLSK